jgi:hypothetical protein
LTGRKPSESIGAKSFEPQERRHMYATVRRYEGVTDPAEVGKRVKEGFLPMIIGIDGFVTYHFIDAGDGVMVSMSVFVDESGEEESNAKAKDWVAENVAELMPNPPSVMAGHVVAQA